MCRLSAHPGRRPPPGCQRRPPGKLSGGGPHGGRSGLLGRRSHESIGLAGADRSPPLRHRQHRPADPQGYPQRAGQTGARSPRRVRGVHLCRGSRHHRRPASRHAVARHRHQRDPFRGLRGRGSPPGRPRAHQRTGRWLCQGPRRCGQGASESAGHRPRSRSRPPPHRPVHALTAREKAPFAG